MTNHPGSPSPEKSVVGDQSSVIRPGFPAARPPSNDGGYEGGDGDSESRGGVGKLGWIFLVILWGYAIYRLGTLWYSHSQYNYGWFVPLLCLMLFWERWKQRPRRDPVRAASGTFLFLGGLAVLLVPVTLSLEVIPLWRFAGWFFALAIVGLTLTTLYLIGGKSYSRHFILPVLFFLIAVPWPSRFEVPMIEKMSTLNAAVSSVAANHLGTPAIRRGVLVETGQGLVGVDEACSGIRSFQASVMIGLFLGELFGYGFLRRMLLLFGGMGVAFACNVARTTYLVRTADLKGLGAVNLRHDQAGFAIMGITFVALLVLAWLLREKSEIRKAESRNWAEANAEKLKTEMLKSEDGGRKTEDGQKAEIFPNTENLKAKMLNAETQPPQSEIPNPDFAPRPSPPDPRPSPTELAAVPPASSIPQPDFDLRSPNSELHALPPVTPRGWLKTALIALVVWVTVIEVGIELWFRAAEQRVASQPRWALKLPTQSREFKQLSISPNVRDMLKYDEGIQAEWRDSAAKAWQIYYLCWLPANNYYRAMDSVAQARGHAADDCLQLAGMNLQANLGTGISNFNGFRMKASTSRFLASGRTFHVFSAYWEPNEAALDSAMQGPGSTLIAIHRALHVLRIRDRGSNEKRVLKMGVWDMGSDEEAEKAFRKYLEQMVVPKG